MDLQLEQKWNEELIAITRSVTDVLSSNLSSDTGKILTYFLLTIENYIAFHQACVAFSNEDQKTLQFVISNEHKEFEFDNSISSPFEGTVSGLVFSQRKPFLSGDLKSEEGFPLSAVIESSRYIYSCICVPIYCNNKGIGTFSLWSEEKNKYSRREMLIMQQLSGLLSIAIESSRLYNEARKSAADISALVQIGQVISSAMELDKLSRCVIEELDKVISFPYAGLYLYNEERNSLKLVDAKGVEGKEREISQEEVLNRHPGWVIKNKSTLLVNDVSTDERIRFPDNENYEIPASLCYVPMLYQDKCFGIIGLASNKKNYFTHDHVRLVTAVAKQVAIAFSRTLLYQREKEMVIKLKEANKLKDEYIGNISHELRTPLTAIIGFSYLLKGGRIGSVSPIQMELIEDVLTSAQNMLHLVEDLLDLSKLQAKKINLNKRETNLQVIIDEVITTVRIMADEISVTIEKYFDDHFPNVYVDPDRMRQIILNLVTNAVKYNREGGSVKIFLQDEKEFLVIKVLDTGIGIKQEDQASVFEQFRQLGGGIRKFRGTGLGLSITKQLVELHGGEILLESELARGSTFTIRLPREHIYTEKSSTIPSTPAIVPVTIVPSGLKPLEEKKKNTILLVEDEVGIRKMVEFLFRDEFEFIFARDGIEGLSETLRHSPDLILMDLALPNMDGYETTKIIKSISRTKDIPIIAFTARITEEDMDKTVLYSFDKIINKPFQPDRLVNEIRDFLSKKSYSKED